jgi:pimeloyl-ACP methyl ester carboxylesterase
MDLHYAGPQTLVKIGRHRRLNLLVAGEGAPTVIFAPGMGATTLEWGRVQHPIARETRTVAFDKAGMGFSDPGPLPRTGSAVVNDLRAALKTAEIHPPYVLVGWSAGGLYMRLFAFRYPEEVAGMVMVDSSNEHQLRRMIEAGDLQIAPAWRKQLRSNSRMARLARAGALVPGTAEYDEFIGDPVPTLTPAVNAARRAQLTSPGYWRAFQSEAVAFQSVTSDQVAAARRPLGDMPLIVLTRETVLPLPDESDAEAEASHAIWCAMHDEIAALSTRGVRRTVGGAGHGIQLDKPEVVIAAIEEVLALARAG